MAKSFQRTERIGQEMQIALSKLISQELKDPRLDVVTITDVQVTRDLAYAKVFIVSRSDDTKQREMTLKVLNQAGNFLRRKLADEVLLRAIPQLQFLYDESDQYGRKIDEILRHL